FIGALFIGIFMIELFIDLGVYRRRKVNQTKYSLIILPVILVGITFVIQFFNGPFFRATDYAALIEVEEKDFETEFFAMDPDKIPMLDRDTAVRLGDRRIGSMSDFVSQFVPADSYTQINVASEPYRVTPLEYSGWMQWFNNRREGIPNYLRSEERRVGKG